MAASSIWEDTFRFWQCAWESVPCGRTGTALLTYTLVALIHLVPKATDKRPRNCGVVGSWYRWSSCWVWAWVGRRVGIRVGPSIHWVSSRDAQIPAILVDTHHVPTASLRDGPAFINICKDRRNDKCQWPPAWYGACPYWSRADGEDDPPALHPTHYNLMLPSIS